MTDLFFTNDDIEFMRDCQDAHMMDTCVIQARVQTIDTYGQRVETFPADSAPVYCGLDMRSGIERHTPDGNVIEYDATIRLPIGTAVLPTYRIKITKRFEETLTTPLVYEVMSPLQQGVSGMRFALRRLEV